MLETGQARYIGRLGVQCRKPSAHQVSCENVTGRLADGVADGVFQIRVGKDHKFTLSFAFTLTLTLTTLTLTRAGTQLVLVIDAFGNPCLAAA